ncbi:hypothetical protein ALP17_111390 [Pseudomonas savastanoi]|uniref:Uncharacterized protein n=1 Tax=Pseudomonas savastanoi TaxID=29438 RepID=A0A3M5ZSS6_PSESS|nr:hypothetical protein ALP17_111390 [Pseudomonas savastanoi]
MADQIGLGTVDRLALGRPLGRCLFLVALGVSLFLLHAYSLARCLDLLRPAVSAFDFLDDTTLKALLEVALDARHQVPVAMTDQRDRQTVATRTAGTTDAVDVIVTAARHVEVDHHVQTFNIKTASRHIGRDHDLGTALLQTVDGRLAVLLVLVAVQHERLVFQCNQTAVQTVGHRLGVGENNGFLVGLVGQQPVQHLLFVHVVIGGDDLVACAGSQLTDAVHLQMLRILEHLADHFPQAGTTGGCGEQHGLLATGTFACQTLDVFREAHVQHAVGFVQYQYFNVLEVQIACVQLLQQTPRRADQNVRHLAQHRGLNLEVLATGDQAGLDEGELREALDFLERLLSQLTGRQQDHRTDVDTNLGRADQTVEDRQHKCGGLAATGLRSHPQVAPLQCERNGGRLHGRRLDKFKLGHSFKQAFVQGEFGKHGCYLDEKQKYSCIA